MYSKIVLALAATASANFMAHPQMKRELQARQTLDLDDISSECTSAVLELYSSLPTPPPRIVDDIMNSPQADLCFSTPASLSKEYASYESEVSSWSSDHADDISSALEECPFISEYTSMMSICETGASQPASATASAATVGASQATLASDSESTASGSAASSGSDASDTSAGAAGTPSNTGNGAARETGMAMAAMAFAGIVVAAL